MFIHPCAGTTGGSNPTPRKNGGTPRTGEPQTGIGEHPLPRTNPNLAATILEHALWMSRQGYRPTTIKGSVKTLKALSRRCNFLIPTEFKTYLANAGYSENRRDKILSEVGLRVCYQCLLFKSVSKLGNCSVNRPLLLRSGAYQFSTPENQNHHFWIIHSIN